MTKVFRTDVGGTVEPPKPEGERKPGERKDARKDMMHRDAERSKKPLGQEYFDGAKK